MHIDITLILEKGTNAAQHMYNNPAQEFNTLHALQALPAPPDAAMALAWTASCPANAQPANSWQQQGAVGMEEVVGGRPKGLHWVPSVRYTSELLPKPALG
jgi:hypothetical protein